MKKAKDKIESPVPILMITWNRLEYTKRALEALLKADNIYLHIFDNGSTDGTREYLATLDSGISITIWQSEKNEGIATAMNVFLKETIGFPVCGKVDSDTIIPKDFIDKMLPCLEHCDMVQAKHHIIKDTHPLGWNGFTANMKKGPNGLLFNHYIGGSGIIFKRALVNKIPQTENKIMGWRQFQRENPNLVKAFTENCEIDLLDAHGYSDYPEYYKQTGRI